MFLCYISCRFICMFSCKVVGYICVFLGSYLKSVDQSECRICGSYALKYYMHGDTNTHNSLWCDSLS